tara:strand:- start:53326 stop:53787 length:462 start_codon:yes stop_codon:yes gene_type:complete
MKNSQTIKQQLSLLKQINKPLDEERYWNCIEKILNNPIKRFNIVNELTKELETYSLEDIKGFYLRTEQLAKDIHTSSLQTIAGKLNEEGCTDDGFDYFISWIISQGKKMYYIAKENPQLLLEELEVGTYDFEQFAFIPDTVFENITGEDLYFY